MKSTIIQILVLLTLLIAYPLFALSNVPEKTSIEGVILDKATQNPVEYANLVLYNTEDSALISGSISSSDGSFRIIDIDLGSYYLSVQFIGYQSYRIDNIEINVDNRNVDLGIISVAPAFVNLQEAIIIGNNDYITFKIDKTVVNVQEQLSAEGGAIVDALTSVPSVQIDGGGNVSLRGSTSFTLLIDGQPSVLEASVALNQIPSSSVDKIEIITNPSVKYDSDGTTGIINLIMKKQKRIGTSGQVTIALATGDKYTGNLMLNQRSKNIRTHLGATYSNKRKQTESKDDRTSIKGDSLNYQNIASDRDIYRRNYKLNGGIGWDISSANSVNLDIEFGQWEYDRQIDSKVLFNNNFETDSAKLSINEDFKINNRYIKSDFGYLHKFSNEDHSIGMNFYISKLHNYTPNTLSQDSIGNSNSIAYTNYISLESESDRNHIRFTTDYTLPVSKKLNLEAGYKLDNKVSTNDFSYKTRISPNYEWLMDSSLSANSDFNRIINSVYGIASTSFQDISLKLGIKFEIVDRTLSESNSTNKSTYNAINIFPSLHLAKSLKEGQQISFSYSRRVNRPNQWMLIPAPRSTGRNMIQEGNPELLPDFTNSLEFGYTKQNDMLLLNSQLYTRLTTNSITPSITEKGGRYYQCYDNLDNELAAGIELMGNLNIRQWWRINLNANAYYYKLKGTLKSGYEVDNNSLVWNGSFRTTFIINSSTYLEFLAIYYGPSILPQGKSKDFYYFDFFVKRNFFNRSLTIALRSHNTFDTGIYIEDTKGANYNAHTWFKYEGPTFMMTATYRLNNFKRHRLRNHLDMNFDSGLDQ